MLQEASAVQFTVGKMDAGMAILLSPDHQLIEFPAAILPGGVKTGSIINLTIERNLDQETKQRENFIKMQNEILDLFAVEPVAPVITTRAITQTSVTIQWDTLQLNRATLLGIDIFRNNQKLNIVPAGTHVKLSGLDVNHDYEIYIRLRTSAGVLKSNILSVKTHTLDNLTGINVCFGEFPTNDDAEIDRLISMIYKIGASFTEELTQDNTHLVCVLPKGPKFERALEWNIPAVSPEFLKACESNGKIQPAHSYYVQKLKQSSEGK